MPLPLLFALFLAFGLDASTLPGASPPAALPQLAPGTIWPRLAGVFGSVAGVGLFAFLVGRQVAGTVASQGRASGRVRKVFRAARLGVDVLSVLLFGLIVHLLYWPQVVRVGLGAGDWLLVDDALILLPFLLAQLVGWWGLFPAERELRALRGIGSREAGGVGRYLGLKARQSFGMVLPVAIVYGLGSDLVHRCWPSTQNSSWEQPVGLVGMGLLVLMIAPALVRLTWPTRPLPPGPLRDRLERLASRVGFRCTDILVWDTNRGLINAGVTGSLPWFRYILLTDALVEDMSPLEVAAVFGHEVGHIAHRHLSFFGYFLLGSLGVFALVGGAIGEGVRALPTPLGLAPGGTGALLVESGVTLAFVGAYFFLVFGHLSRKFEAQADVFGCRVVSCDRPHCPPHADVDSLPSPLSVAPLSATSPLCPVGIRIFISALENVATRNGMASKSWSWRHGSILRRIAFLESLSGSPPAERRFQMSVRRLRLVLGVALAATALVATVAATW